jgi:hypothetical protein
MIDTTDALEAVNACQTMKNFLFLLIFVGLLVCQIVFWMNHFDLVSHDGRTPCPAGIKADGSAAASSCCPKSSPQATLSERSQGQESLVYLAATAQAQDQPEAEAAPSEAPKSIEQTIDRIVDAANSKKPEESLLPEKEAERIPAEIPTEHATPEMLEPQTPDDPAEAAAEDDILADKKALFRISGGCATKLVAICNYVILIAAVLYSLSLLVCLKISLVGRLGGISHIARAFFASLFLLVILIPWQRVLPGVLIGALWRPGALWCECWARADSSLFWTILFYLRFCGLWLVAIWLLLMAQSRSSKWARATLRRLGVVR